ncbi:pol-like protein [Apostichopus japonicus]|uniref:Pol-like protein n=1 Tax=Stichopus japonicus TaxID=307972 RepID=A0A2G8JLJ4_STIJA|nr:pol-like protein [Apostichopus japonicus]
MVRIHGFGRASEGVLPGLLGNNRTDIRAVFEDAFQNGLLNQSQRLGMITLLPKSGDPLDPHNKRPITLLNVDYKLLARALCNRLALAMPHLVGDLRTCAVKGHCIQQNLWLMRDLTDFVIERDLPCALVSLDQQKAFDMVDRGFLMKTCPIRCARGAKVKCIQYADDVTCVVSSLGSFRALSQDLSIFERATGAKLNPEKTKGLRLGSWRYINLPFGASWSDQNIKMNGIWYGYDAPCGVTWNERAERYLRAGSKPLAPAGCRSWGKSPLLIVLFRPSCGTRARCTLFRVASWCGYFHSFGRVVQSLSTKTGEGRTRGGSSGK